MDSIRILEFEISSDLFLDNFHILYQTRSEASIISLGCVSGAFRDKNIYLENIKGEKKYIAVERKVNKFHLRPK